MTTTHVGDELPSLLLGQADRATVSSSTAHLRDCEDCRDELINALAAHAALSSAAAFAADLLAPDLITTDLTATDLGIADRITADLGTTERRPNQLADPDVDSPTVARGDRSRRTVPVRWLAAAAAVAIGGSAIVVATTHHSDGQAVALIAYGLGSTSAQARVMSDNEVRVDASSLPVLAPGEHYEVWLTDGGRTVTIPVGALGVGGTGDFRTAAAVHDFSAIEVSIQTPASGDTYSGVSVLRGTFS